MLEKRTAHLPDGKNIFRLYSTLQLDPTTPAAVILEYDGVRYLDLQMMRDSININSSELQVDSRPPSLSKRSETVSTHLLVLSDKEENPDLTKLVSVRCWLAIYGSSKKNRDRCVLEI